MKKLVRLLMSIFLVINTILGYLAGAGSVPEELFFRVFILLSGKLKGASSVRLF